MAGIVATTALRPRSAALRSAILVLLVALAGCVPVFVDRGSPPADRGAERECYATLAEFDSSVERAGVRDAEAVRVQGFPYLRANRFAASFIDRIQTEPVLYPAVLSYMRSLDRAARRVEAANLPARAGPVPGLAAVERCADRLAVLDAARPDVAKLVAARTRVPDDYVEWERVVGMYAMAKVAVLPGIELWHADSRKAFAASASSSASPPGAIDYVPEPPGRESMAAGALPLPEIPRDALGQLVMDAPTRERLFDRHAPVFRVASGAAYDRPGVMRLEGPDRPVVDVSRPAVYRRLAYTRYRGATLPQLVYTIWFPERPTRGRIDPLAGHLDGIVYRITLGARGEVAMADAMHPCGCWHLFFPPAGARPVPALPGPDEWMFSPASFPPQRPRERIVLTLESGTHALVGIRSQAEPEGTRYALLDEDGLRTLALPGGGSRSLYGPDALVPASRRTERLLFWPMGIPSAGTMRQWGHHATAFVGHRHFDEADLLERRFELAGETARAAR